MSINSLLTNQPILNALKAQIGGVGPTGPTGPPGLVSKTLSTFSTTSYLLTTTPTTYLSITFTPTINGNVYSYSYTNFISSTGGNVVMQSQLYKGTSPIGQVAQLTNGGNGHYQQLSVGAVTTSVAGVPMTITTKVNTVAPDGITTTNGYLNVIYDLI